MKRQVFEDYQRKQSLLFPPSISEMMPPEFLTLAKNSVFIEENR